MITKYNVFNTNMPDKNGNAYQIMKVKMLSDREEW